MRAVRSWIAFLWPALVLVTVAVLIHARQLLGQRLFLRDTLWMFVPAKTFLAETLRRGELPQWWPYDGNGTPFLAQSLFSVFHPSTLAYLVLPFWKAFTFQDMVGTLLALAGAYVLVRRLDGSRAAALIAAVVFGANGYFTSVTEFPFTHLSLGTMPWYVWSLLQAEDRRGPWWVVPPLVMGSLLLAGDPQVALLTSLAGAVVLLSARGVSRRILLSSVGAPLLGAAVAAIQLLPAIEVVPETNRALTLREGNLWPLEAKHLAGLVLPTRWGTADFCSSTLIGAGAVLVFATLAHLKQRRIAALWGLVTLGVWLGLGDNYGLNRLARSVVPMWSSFRYPIKSYALALFALSLLSAIGFDLLMQRERKRLAAGLAFGAATVMVLVALRVQTPLAVSSWWWVAYAAGAATVLLPFRREAQRWVSLALISTPLLYSAATQLVMVDGGFYSEQPLVSAMRKEGVSLDGTSFARLGVRIRNEYERTVGYVATGGGVGGGLASVFHMPSIGTYTPGASLRMTSLFNLRVMPPERMAWLMGLLGTGVLVVPPAEQGRPVIAMDPNFGYQAVRNEGALPRGYAVHRAVGMPEWLDIYNRLLDGKMASGREVLLEADPNTTWAMRPLVDPVPLRVRHPSNTRVLMEGALPWPGFAVLNETSGNGWSVTVDDQPSEWFVANGAVRAVEVPQGTHRIEWRYEAPGLQLGKVISLATLALLALVAVLNRRKGLLTPHGER